MVLILTRYSSTRNIFSTLDVSFNYSNNNNKQQLIYDITTSITDEDSWTTVFQPTINAIIKEAPTGGKKKFATKEAALYSPPSQQQQDLKTLYSLAECTPDLTTEDCLRCFKVAIGYLPTNYTPMGIVLLPSCNLRCDLNPFYELESDLIAPSPSLRPNDHNKPWDNASTPNSSPINKFPTTVGGKKWIRRKRRLHFASYLVHYLHLLPLDSQDQEEEK